MSTITEPEQATTECEGCRKDFPYTPAIFRGSTLPPPAKCEGCEDADEQAEQTRMLADQRQEAFGRRAQAAKIPSTFRGIAYPDSPAADRAREWGSAAIDGLYLTGNYGVGKTHLAAAACWDRLTREPIRWVSVSQLMTQLRMGFDQRESLDAKQVVAGVGGVVLDDLDKINPTEFGCEVLFTIIDGRVQEGAPLLVTANLSIGELGNRLGGAVGGAIASRLAGYCRKVKVEGRDQRVQP